MSSAPQFDLVLLGATGYTGSLAAEHIAKSFSKSLKWAIAGRSSESLEDLSEKLKIVNPDRVSPGIEVVELNDVELNELALKTRVLINAIGPYHRFSSPILGACARNGTHYVDCTTETLWIKDMIDKYHTTATESGAIIVPAISLSSSPSDLIAWLIVTSIQAQGFKGTSEITSSSKLDLIGMSGGSFATVLDLQDAYGSSWFLTGSSRVLSPAPNSAPPSTLSLVTKLFGYRNVPQLGTLTTSFVGPGNEAVVHRSSALNPSLYGPLFTFREYIPVPNMLSAILVHFLTWSGTLLLAIPIFRSLMRKVGPKQGSGPTLEESREKESVEFKAVGYVKGEEKPRTMAKFKWKGSAYEVSGVLAAEAAGVLLERAREAESRGVNMKGKGGIFTPSSLGMPFVERLRNAGVSIEVVKL